MLAKSETMVDKAKIKPNYSRLVKVIACVASYVIACVRDCVYTTITTYCCVNDYAE